MIPAQPLPDEARRLEVLRGYAVLDTLPEQALDDLTALAAQICGTPIALVSLVDEERQWFKAKVGVEMSETPRDFSFCGHATHQQELFVVPDATLDVRFADNPLVTGESHIRFYAGAPLVSPEGAALGALCVMDHLPRALTPAQEQSLLVLGRQVMTQLELSRQTRELREREEQLRLYAEHSPVAVAMLDREMKYLVVSRRWMEDFRLVGQPIIGRSHYEVFPEIPERWKEIHRRCLAGAMEKCDEEPFLRQDGTTDWIRWEIRPWRQADGSVGGIIIFTENITKRIESEQASLRLAAIVEFSDDAIIGKNLNSIITSWNRGAEKIFGYTAEEMVGASIMRLIPSDRQEDETLILGKIRQGESVEHFETKRRTKDGKLIDVSVTASPIKDASGKVIGVSKIARDITERMQTEQHLRLLKTCVSKLNDIILIADADLIDEPGPNIVFVNEAFERITGYNPTEAVGRSPRFLQGPKTDRAVLAEIRKAMMERRPIRRQLINYRKDGSEYWMDVDIVPIFDAGGQCTHFAAIEHDITQEKKAAEQLQLFRTLIDRSNDSIEVIDAKTGRILDVNETACRRLGYTREELLSLSVPDIGEPGEGSLSIEAEFEEIRKSGFKIIETRHRRKDGTTFPIEVNVKYIDLNEGYLLSVVRDISERKQAEARIADQAALLDKAQDAIVELDLDRKVIYWNQGAERIYGWTRAEVIGRNTGQFFYTRANQFEEVNSLTINQGEWSGELVHLTKDKREIVVQSRRTLIRDNEGRPKSLLVINTDITEQKKIEAQFMRAQRMESIGTLAGGVAHDLNNILAPIMMSIDILKVISDNPQAQKILETIEISAKRGSDIVRQVLSFARGMEGERIEVQPKHLLKDLEHIIRDTFPKDVRLQFSIPSDTWTILGDPTQVHQILLNLCVNARDAMPNGGTLSVSVENSLLDEQYAAMNIQARAGRFVCITVADSGTGIPREVLDKIFEPFFTTKALHKGTGLGLSTVMAIVKSHEGIINVYSELGQGTTFKVYLPAMEVSAEGRKEQVQQDNLPRGNGETILVVDDETSILTITGQTLQAFGYQVLTATDGADAVAIYAQHRNKIAVVLTDMAMPVMDGAATIHALIRINPKIKIVAASGLNANGGVAKASSAGIKHFLSKPYTAGTLLKTIRAILEEV